jgi:nitric oxide reductase NorQ protein
VFGHPSVNVETTIIQTESGLSQEDSHKLAEMGSKIRELKGFGLDEGVSSRLLVYVGRLIKEGLTPVEACSCAISHTLTDEAEVWSSIQDIVQLYFGNLMENE